MTSYEKTLEALTNRLVPTFETIEKRLGSVSFEKVRENIKAMCIASFELGMYTEKQLHKNKFGRMFDTIEGNIVVRSIDEVALFIPYTQLLLTKVNRRKHHFEFNKEELEVLTKALEIIVNKEVL